MMVGTSFYYISQITRPVNPAFMRLMNADTNEVIYEVDVSKDTDAVQFSESKISLLFDDPNDKVGKQRLHVKLQLDEGAALPADGIGCHSELAVWTFYSAESSIGRGKI